MLSRHSPTSADALKARVTVTDLLGVQRILTLLTGRNCKVTRFEAEEAGAGRWRISFDSITSADEAELLEARLLRIPSVLTVYLTWAGALAAAG